MFSDKEINDYVVNFKRNENIELSKEDAISCLVQKASEENQKWMEKQFTEDRKYRPYHVS
jgi:hypothetical protein